MANLRAFPAWLLVCFFLGGAARAENALPRAPTPAELTQLTESLEKTAADLYRWACTQTMVQRDEKGRVKSQVVLRYDPSKPYPEQWTPISVDGKPPEPGDIRKYRRWGLRAQQRAENPESDTRPTLGEVMNVPAARVVSVDATHLTFNVPLRKDRNERFPPEKFEVMVKLRRDNGALENIAVQLRASFRTKLVVKVKSGEGNLNFATVDPQRAPTLVDLRGDASASIFFVSVGGEYELKRTDFKYVKPYHERFEVQIGPMRAIDF
jgi:hypothetical protein